MRRQALTVLICLIAFLLTTAQPSIADQRCSTWEQWVYANTYSVIMRSCINHGSVVTGKTEAYLDWSGLPPEFDFFSLTTQVYKNGNRVGSDICNRTAAANNPGAHNTPGEAMICLVSENLTSGQWRARSASCVDPAVPQFNWTRCSNNTDYFPSGWIHSPIHNL